MEQICCSFINYIWIFQYNDMTKVKVQPDAKVAYVKEGKTVNDTLTNAPPEHEVLFYRLGVSHKTVVLFVLFLIES